MTGVQTCALPISVLDGIPHNQEYTPSNPELFTKELCFSFLSHLSLITLLFSGREQGQLPNRLETRIKETIFQKYPAYRGDPAKNIILSYCIQGAYHSFVNNRETDTAILLDVICGIAKSIRSLYEDEESA